MTTSTSGAAARRGRPWALIVVARREDRLQALADRLGDVHDSATEVLVADLTVPEDLRRVEARIASGPPLPPGRAVYAATKAYVNAFTQLLHGELAGTGVRVQALTGRPATGCGAVCSRAR
jgi:short-subunit dehydrogenase